MATVTHDNFASLKEKILADFNGNEYNALIFFDRYAQKKSKFEPTKVGDVGVIHYRNAEGRKNTALVCVTDVVKKEDAGNSQHLQDFLSSGIFETGNVKSSISKSVEEYDVYILIGDWNPESAYATGKIVHVSHVDVCRETSFEEYALRIAREGSMGEKNLQGSIFKLVNGKVLSPAGRIASGLGNTEQASLFNCTVNERPLDSRDHIMKVIHTSFNMLAKGNGVGIDWSALRPEKSFVKGVQGYAGGPVGFMKIMNAVGKEVSQGGGRGAAMMFTLADWHPDVLKFITSKLQFDENGRRLPDAIDKANISVTISDKFMEAVEKDGDWYFIFPDTNHPKYDAEWDGDIEEWMAKGYDIRVYGKIRAREMWRKIIETAHESGEPGVIFMERYNKMSNSAYYAKIISTNPCGEQGLPAFGFCNLAHTNLGKMESEVPADLPSQVVRLMNERPNMSEKVKQALRYVNWNLLSESIRTGVRLQDNCIDINCYDYPEQERQQKGERRIGHGTMGLDDLLKSPFIDFAYGEQDALDFAFVLYGYYAYCAYDESIEIAKEKGPFPFFDREKHKERPFIRRMFRHFPELEEKFDKYGIRNVTLLTQAPTGTTGTMLGASTGIEPHYALRSKRVTNIGTGLSAVRKRADHSHVSASCMHLNAGDEARLMYRLDDEGKPYIVQNKKNKPVWIRGTIVGSFVKDGMEYLSVEVVDGGVKKVWDMPKSAVRGKTKITPTMHTAMQNTIQYWVDSSISKTVNMPAGATVEEVMEVYESAYKLGEIKGVTVYVDMSRTDQVLYAQDVLPDEYKLENVRVVTEDEHAIQSAEAFAEPAAGEACTITYDPHTGQLVKSCAG